MNSRVYQLSSCPVQIIVWPTTAGGAIDGSYEVIDCNADCAVEVTVHEDGAEYGVWVSDYQYAKCGHLDGDIKKAEQNRLLGIEA